MKTHEENLVERCRKYLDGRWRCILEATESAGIEGLADADSNTLRACILACLTSPTKSYHYVLPTQILVKCVAPDVDCHALQASYRKRGAFDARTIAHDVIVPFDQANHRVLGGSAEPYVNNPLRCPAVTKRYRGNQKNQADWDKLVTVLDAVEAKNCTQYSRQVLDQILLEIHGLLAHVQVVYPIPNRISLEQTRAIIAAFLGDKSGGDRTEVIAAALFRAVSSVFGLFDEVRRQKVNAADAASGMGADIECWQSSRLVLLVEVKDRALTLTQLDAKLDVARVKRISEILFLAERGVERDDVQPAQERIRSEFVSGQNIYVSNLLDFSSGVLILMGEKGRVEFLENVGRELDAANSAIAHRRAWAQLLKSV